MRARPRVCRSYITGIVRPVSSSGFREKGYIAWMVGARRIDTHYCDLPRKPCRGRHVGFVLTAYEIPFRRDTHRYTPGGRVVDQMDNCVMYLSASRAALDVG
jgi:hypothetical protein